MVIIYEKKNLIAYLTINRPEARDAIDPETATELLDAWEYYREDENCLCAIITGAGDRSFCSGFDLGRMIPLLSGGRRPETDADKRICANPALLEESTLRNFELFKLVISSINGLAIGGGRNSFRDRYPHCI